MAMGKTGTWQGKDAVRLAIFSVLLFVAMLIGAIPFSVMMSTYFYGDALGAVLAGIVWMYMRSTIRKPWACLASSVIVAVIAFLFGQIWTAVLSIVVGGVLSEVIERIGAFENTAAHIVAFVVWVLCFWVGHAVLAIFSVDAFAQTMLNAHMTQEQVDILLAGISGMNVLFAPAACAIGALVGGGLGYAIFRKHFSRAEKA